MSTGEGLTEKTLQRQDRGDEFVSTQLEGGKAMCGHLRHAALCLAAWLRVRGRAGASSGPADGGSCCIVRLHARVSSSANLRVCISRMARAKLACNRSPSSPCVPRTPFTH